MAFEIVAGLCVTYLGVIGVISFSHLYSEWDITLLEKDRFYGGAPFVVDHLIMPMLSYQLWNLLLCLCNNDLRDPNMIGTISSFSCIS
jgi:hypothetical protein